VWVCLVNADRRTVLEGADGADLDGDRTEITDADIEASNGFVHVIDGVLLT